MLITSDDHIQAFGKSAGPVLSVLWIGLCDFQSHE